MSVNQSLLEQLEQMLHWKKSKKVYAEKLGVTEEVVDELLKELRERDKVRDDAEVALTEAEQMIEYYGLNK